MATNTTSSATLSTVTRAHIERQMLRYAAATRTLEKTGMMKQVNRNHNGKITFRRPKLFTEKTVPLAEGVTPASDVFQYDHYEATLSEYGQVVDFTGRIEDNHEHPVVQDITEMLSDNVARTMEALDYAVVKAGTNVIYANGANRAAVNTALTLNALQRATRALHAQKARKFTQVLSGSPDYNTSPIEAAYIAMCHTDVMADIRALAGFVPVAEYGSRSVICQEEFGSVQDVRFVCNADLAPFIGAGSGTKNGMVGDSNVDVYPTLVFGREAWASIALRGQGAVSPTIIPSSRAEKSDPLGQVGKAGWKAYHAAVILAPLWMVRIEHGVDDLL